MKCYERQILIGPIYHQNRLDWHFCEKADIWFHIANVVGGWHEMRHSINMYWAIVMTSVFILIQWLIQVHVQWFLCWKTTISAVMMCLLRRCTNFTLCRRRAHSQKKLIWNNQFHCSKMWTTKLIKLI